MNEKFEVSQYNQETGGYDVSFSYPLTGQRGSGRYHIATFIEEEKAIEYAEWMNQKLPDSQ